MAAALLCACTAGGPSYDGLTAENHPRLFADDTEFASIKATIESGENEIMGLLHKNAMELADIHGLSPEPIVYKMDASGKRLLPVSREAVTRIFSAAYAYRFTGDERYLHHAETDLNTVCSFKDWNPSHYLDCAEMATGVAVGYDWLYPALQDSTKVKVLAKLSEFAFDTASEDLFWYSAHTNWNQVCNAGLCCAALATFESNPEVSKTLIERAVATNTPAVKSIYAPVGAYPEGPVYWNYGNMFQTLLLSEFETVLGTDFGIADAEGFSNTGVFQSFTIGNTGKVFNYYDNLPLQIPNYPLWYLAWKFDCPEILYNDVQLLRSKPYYDLECERLLPLYIVYAARIDPSRIKPLEQRTFFSEGQVPVVMARTGCGPDDLYLGAKGGNASLSHGHMDTGEFVFEAGGVRWACDTGRQEYEDIENPCKQMGGDFWDFTQNSVRWKLFRFNCRQHNTLTVNNKDHDVDARGEMIARFDETARMGAAFDLTPLFWGDLASAVREVSIREGKYLEVVDRLKGGAQDADVLWTMLSDGTPEITTDGIVLRAKDRKMLLKAEGAEVEYCIRPSDPAAAGWPTAWCESPIPEHICCLRFRVPACADLTLTVTLFGSHTNFRGSLSEDCA